MTRLCFLDSETTGVHDRRQLWEVGMILRTTSPDGDRLETERQFYVEVDLADADRFGLGIGRFWERHPLGRYLSSQDMDPPIPSTDGNYLTRAAAAFEVCRWTIGAHVLGAVANFDTETLTPLLRSYGLLGMWHYHLGDVENLAAGRLQLEPPWDSDDLAKRLGVARPEEEKHTALGDARWARDMYDAVMGIGHA